MKHYVMFNIDYCLQYSNATFVSNLRCRAYIYVPQKKLTQCILVVNHNVYFSSPFESNQNVSQTEPVLSDVKGVDLYIGYMAGFSADIGGVIIIKQYR